MSTAANEIPYSFTFDKARRVWTCSIHGEVEMAGWVQCWAGCEDGWFDEYEEDPINSDPGDISPCSECKGAGGWMVCGECNANNPDVEW